MAKNKHSGQVFTPNYLVCDILDVAHYNSTKILQKNVIDNSCGDGAFLCEIVKRYCYFFKGEKDELIKELETYIHGIEYDKDTYLICIKNLNETIKQYNIGEIHWDIREANTLKVIDFNNKMDFVIGNPPYVRVHNLEDDYSDVKSFHFADNGMTDLFLVFFEIGFNMLKQGGTLCYITPNSWLNSIAGNNLRKYIKEQRNIIKLVDLEHFQPFKATTYTLISCFQKGITHNQFEYSIYDGTNHSIKTIENLNLEDCFIGKSMYLSASEELIKFKQIQHTSFNKFVEVKNGFATLADKVFIAKEFTFNNMIIPVIKASTGKWYKAFFPYDKNGKPLNYNEIFDNSSINDYLFQNKKILLKGKDEKEVRDWYLYGRTQALKDVYTNKYSINTVIRNIESIKLNIVPSGCGVYSGLYIITKVDYTIIKEAILCEEFIDYIKILKKYKSGGYYTFSSKDLELYLNYKITVILSNNEKNKSRFSDYTLGFF